MSEKKLNLVSLQTTILSDRDSIYLVRLVQKSSKLPCLK